MLQRSADIFIKGLWPVENAKHAWERAEYKSLNDFWSVRELRDKERNASPSLMSCCLDSVADKFNICFTEQNFKRAELITHHNHNCAYLNKNVLQTFKMITESRWTTGCDQICPLDLRGSQVRGWRGEMAERWCDRSSSSSSRSVRRESKRERGTWSWCIVHCRRDGSEIWGQCAQWQRGTVRKVLVWKCEKSPQVRYSVSEGRGKTRSCTSFIVRFIYQEYLGCISPHQLHLRRW